MAAANQGGSVPVAGRHSEPEMYGPRHDHRLAAMLRRLDVPRGSRVLDAAAGIGLFAERMRERGHRPFGIDFELLSAVHARRRAGLPFVVGDVSQLPFRDGVFDAVTSGETLEHLDDDFGAAREFARVVRVGGACLVMVPALQALWSASDEYNLHRRRYSRERLRSLFAPLPFDVRSVRFWGFPLVLAYDFLFVLPMNRRRMKARLAEDRGLQSVARAGRTRWLVRLVRAAFSVDRLFSFVPFGPELILIARRR
ncbi:MAG: methyltransferase domain-containing protein [Thermoanaerobaculia bacterium]